MNETVNRVLVEAVESRDKLIADLVHDLVTARAVAESAHRDLRSVTDGAKGEYTENLEWGRTYAGAWPARVSGQALTKLKGTTS